MQCISLLEKPLTMDAKVSWDPGRERVNENVQLVARTTPGAGAKVEVTVTLLQLVVT